MIFAIDSSASTPSAFSLIFFMGHVPRSADSDRREGTAVATDVPKGDCVISEKRYTRRILLKGAWKHGRWHS
jgi:hypothetical protein